MGSVAIFCAYIIAATEINRLQFHIGKLVPRSCKAFTRSAHSSAESPSVLFISKMFANLNIMEDMMIVYNFVGEIPDIYK